MVFIFTIISSIIEVPLVLDKMNFGCPYVFGVHSRCWRTPDSFGFSIGEVAHRLCAIKTNTVASSVSEIIPFTGLGYPGIGGRCQQRICEFMFLRRSGVLRT